MVKVALAFAPSCTVADAAAMSRRGVSAPSSFSIVTVARGAAMTAWVGEAACCDRVTAKVSSTSATASPDTAMVIVAEVCPAARVTVPLGSCPPKSAASAAALPKPVTAKSSTRSAVESPVRYTSKTTFVLPLLRSVTVAVRAAMVMTGAAAGAFEVVDCCVGASACVAPFRKLASPVSATSSRAACRSAGSVIPAASSSASARWRRASGRASTDSTCRGKLRSV